MNGCKYIIEKQLAWADRNKITLIGSQVTKGALHYTIDFNDNLFHKLDSDTLADFSIADGGELISTPTKAAKMSAVHSSSAICVNILQYWKKNAPEISYALGLCNKNNKYPNDLKFEQKFQISNNKNVFRKDPNIDALIINDPKSAIKVFGIECKFSEAYSSRKHPGLKKAYLSEITDLWNDIPNLKDLASNICPDDNSFNHLHSAQLIKHILGLKRTYHKNGFRLLYLWYDVLGNDGKKHRKEIKKFTEIAKADNIKFHSISYQELLVKLRKEFYSGNEAYINYLTDRYL